MRFGEANRGCDDALPWCLKDTIPPLEWYEESLDVATYPSPVAPSCLLAANLFKPCAYASSTRLLSCGIVSAAHRCSVRRTDS